MDLETWWGLKLTWEGGGASNGTGNEVGLKMDLGMRLVWSLLKTTHCNVNND